VIEESAVVTKIDNQQVWIKSLQSGACGGCMQQTSCGTATLSKLLPKREFAVDCDLTLKVGDQVKVAIDDSHLLFSSLLLYLLPLLIMLVGVTLADFWLPVAVSEVWLPVMALLLLLTAFWAIHRFQALLLLHFCFRPQIVEKIFGLNNAISWTASNDCLNPFRFANQNSPSARHLSLGFNSKG
jgi:sigma-E factor negative regulatory protein RseC